MINLQQIFESHDDEFLKFNRIVQPLSRRPDIHAFLLLDQIVEPKVNYSGGFNDIVASAAHDEIWLDVDIEQLAENATEDQIVDLIRCGVRFDDDIESLCLYV